MRASLLLYRCHCHSVFFGFVVCVTDDGEIGTNNSINTIVNCINCTLLTTLAQVTNACMVRSIRMPILCGSKSTRTKVHSPCSVRSISSGYCVDIIIHTKFALKSNLLIWKVSFFSSHRTLTNFAVLSKTCGNNQWN